METPTSLLPGSQVLVLGSLNVDSQLSVDTLPRPGQTVIGERLRVMPGGKGGNQAVAAARLGARVAIAGRIGADAHGDLLRETLRREGVATDQLIIDELEPTGTALILVSSAGENMIAVAPGANACIAEKDAMHAISTLGPADLLLLQLEIPLQVVRTAAIRAAERGTTVILNAAPALDLGDDLLAAVDVLIVNEGEAVSLFGSVEDSLRAARHVVVTLGAAGAVVSGDTGPTRLAAPSVEPIDTTGAGDAFVGAVAAQLAGGRTFVEAAQLAVVAGAAATLAYGGQSALPRPEALSPLQTEATGAV